MRAIDDLLDSRFLLRRPLYNPSFRGIFDRSAHCIIAILHYKRRHRCCREKYRAFEVKRPSD